MLKIFNSLTGEKEVFTPLNDNQVRMYVCGMTVYDLCHIGHARMVLVFDMVTKYLRAQGYDVTYVRNITDIDDKIIQRAAENNESIESLTERTIGYMHEDFDALGIARPDIEPRATETIPEMLAMIKTLVDKDLAYQSSNGDVLYRVSKFPDYGKLSKKRLEDLRAGERVAVNSDKDDPLDFVLWKSAKPDEPAWDSEFGRGRPGWHIECSAMSHKHLGKSFDIHGGGMDLKFPHHENEIAQSEGVHNCKYAQLWMHNGFINVDNEKMSKSLGNFFTIRDVLAKYHPEVLRGFVLGTHYRKPLNFSDTALNQAKVTVDKFYNAIHETQPEKGQLVKSFEKRFIDSMNEDFNTVGALSVLHEISAQLTKAKKTDAKGIDGHSVNDLARTLIALTTQLGWLQTPVEDYLAYNQANATSAGQSDADIDAMVKARDEARAAKNFAEADRLRDVLVALNISLEDSADGTKWSRN